MPLNMSDLSYRFSLLKALLINVTTTVTMSLPLHNQRQPMVQAVHSSIAGIIWTC